MQSIEYIFIQTTREKYPNDTQGNTNYIYIYVIDHRINQ